MEWTTEIVFKFLDSFEDDPIIWNPKKNYIQIEMQWLMPWRRFQEKMPEFTVEEMKKKKKPIFSVCRNLRSKFIKIQKTGTEASEIEKYNWFAFKILDRFLRDVYQPKVTINTEVYKNNLLKCSYLDINSNY